MSGDNFVDLRLNAHSGGGGEDSVWPSFTDIMTVIVMIFLMVLLSFLIRNTQLVEELKSTIEEKDAASSVALLSAEENSSLQEQLAKVRERMLSLQTTLEDVTGQRMTLAEKLEAREKAVSDLEIEIALLSKLRDELTISNAGLLNNNAGLSDKNESLIDKNKGLLSQNTSLLDESKIASQSIADLTLDLEGAKNTLNEKIALLLAEKAGLIIAKDKTSTQLSSSELEKAELNKTLISITEQLRLVREQVESQTSENSELNQKLEDQNTLMLGLQTSKEEMERKIAEIAENLAKLNLLYSSRGARLVTLQDKLDARGDEMLALQAKLDSRAEELVALQAKLSTRGEEVVALTAQLEGRSQRFKSLQEEFDSLDEKYRKLIRPARNSAGKHIVRVEQVHRNGKSVFSLTEPGGTAKILPKADMHARLAVLRKQHGSKLYTKVVIPADSGLSFDEGWKFTQSILSQYDYYAQDFAEVTEPKSKPQTKLKTKPKPKAQPVAPSAASSKAPSETPSKTKAKAQP